MDTCHHKVTLSSVILWSRDRTSLQNSSQAKCSLSNDVVEKDPLLTYMNMPWKIPTTTCNVCTTYWEKSRVNFGKCLKWEISLKSMNLKDYKGITDILQLWIQANFIRNVCNQLFIRSQIKQNKKLNQKENSSLLLHQFFQGFLGLLFLPVKCRKQMIEFTRKVISFICVY